VPQPYWNVGRVKKLGCKTEEHDPLQRSSGMPDATSLERASRLFKAIGEAPRLRLLTLLARGEVCVTELAEAEGETLSTISHRLRILRNENIVQGRRRGKHINYALADQHILDLLSNALAHAGEEPGSEDGHPKTKSRKQTSKRHLG